MLAGQPSAAPASAWLAVADALESSLRLLLRDDPGAPLAVRLSALAPAETGRDALLSELRSRERISIELAAGAHEVFRSRGQLSGGIEPAEGETRALIRATELAEDEIAREIANHAAEAPRPRPLEHEPVHTVPAPLAPGAGRFRWQIAAVIAGGAAILLLLVMWLGPGRQAGEMEEAIALFRTGAWEQALPHFRSHAESNPGDATAWLYIARIHRRSGRLPEARDAIRAGLAAAPADVGLQRELGYVLLDGGQPRAAVTRFRDAVARAPEAPDAWVGLVRALRETGDDAAAARVLSRAPAEVRALLGSSPP